MNNNYPPKVFGGAGTMTRLRGRLSIVDPSNLTQVILAEGIWRKQRVLKES
jgi:hypothetical protein